MIVIDDRFSVLLNETDMNVIGKVHRLRRHQAAVAKASLVFAILISCANARRSMRRRSLKSQQR